MTARRHEKQAAKEIADKLGIPYAAAIRHIQNIHDHDPGLRGESLVEEVGKLVKAENKPK